MIPVSQALDTVLAHKTTLTPHLLPLSEATGMVLNEDLVADRAFPPFDRVAMDGIAIAFDAYQNGQRTFSIETTAPAGTPQKKLFEPDACIEVMTGAMLPEGCDTVIRYEDISFQGSKATIQLDTLERHKNVHQKGTDRQAGTVIIPKGKRIGSPEIGVAASIGKTHLQVLQLPRTVLISTGDELIDIDQTPEPHQIRKSNVYQLQASLRQWGLYTDMLHLNDDKKTMENQMRGVLQNYDLVIMSGGVSKGKYDHVPHILDVLGVKKLFHRVRQRPGKPFWFGQAPDQTTIFALPGNPVSTFMCATRYVKPWLEASMGIIPRVTYAVLEKEVIFRPDLTYYMQVQLSSNFDGKLLAVPIEGRGSGDLANLMQVDAFMELPEGKNVFQKGEVYPVFPFRW